MPAHFGVCVCSLAGSNLIDLHACAVWREEKTAWARGKRECAVCLVGRTNLHTGAKGRAACLHAREKPMHSLIAGEWLPRRLRGA
jgi:hypothetical protein